VVITWDTSAAGANYKFIFGNPNVPPRRLTIPSNSNSITTTLGALDIVLAANGFTNNGSATDSAVGQWDVWAYKGPNAPGPDSLKATNGPRAITLKRQQVSLSAFSLSAPASGITVITSPVDLTTITFSWTRSAQGASYRWLYKTGTFSDPPTFRISANNGGLDTFWTVRKSRLDSLLAGVGVNAGDSVTGQWRARAYATGDSLNSNAPDRGITFRRVGLLPLNQDFSSTTFPPPFWGLDAGGGTTQYWTRDAVGGYQVGSGSAKYDFWSAIPTTPLQTLTSNQFPPVTANNNVLKFDYSQAYYLSGGVLADDSCIIETSNNNGSTWIRLIGMGASLTLTSGTNSSPNMSTFASQSSFTPTLASQWATKVFTMPVGTNKVRFVAKTDYGNNLFLDNIVSTGSVGIGENELSLTPDKYSLQQNYPNPFNPSTSINFSIPKSGLVTLKIYDVLGKEVATLVNEVKTAGNYSLDFNAYNLTSGVYFYKIESGSFSDIKRMMLIK
ncbi:MAG: T9SS type A sorting domain-containing protein, partial [bacterium]